MPKKEDIQVPNFGSLEEERQYWEKESPLAEGKRGKINEPQSKEKRTSFLTVRVTGTELTQIRDMAAMSGMGPSTFVRSVLKSLVEQWKSSQQQFNYLYDAHNLNRHNSAVISNDLVTGISHACETTFLNLNTNSKAYCILNPEDLQNMAKMVVAWQKFQKYFAGITESCQASIVTEKDDVYKDVKRIANIQR